MSTRIMSLCWPLRMGAAAKAVLVSLADQANDDGVCWPSQQSLCDRTCLGERAVRSALRWLEQAGLLSTDVRHDKRGRRSSNCYTVTPQNFCPERATAVGGDSGHSSAPAPTAESTGLKAANGDDVATPPAPNAAEVGGSAPSISAAPPALNADGTTGSKCRHHRQQMPGHYIEPSKEPNTPQPPKRGAQALLSGSVLDAPVSVDDTKLITLADALAVAKAWGVRAIPADDPIWAYAADVGIPEEFLELAWHEFKARRSGASKRQRGLRGWRQAFRNSVRDNWFRLWYIPAGRRVAELSTVGKQAMMALEAARAARDAARAEQAAQAGADEELGGTDGSL